MYDYNPNPYGYPQPQMVRPGMQRHEVIRVNGRGGAEAFQMAPNSDVLLLDTTGPIVWLKTTDGAGYATCTAYNITPYQPEPQIDTTALLARIERLEGILNAQPDHASAKLSKTAEQ